MKKLLAFLLCAILCLSMAGVMSACGDGESADKSKDKNTASVSDENKVPAAPKSDEELIIGEWEADIDFNEQLLAAISGAEGDEMSEMMKYFDLSGLTLKMGMEFKNDGTVKAVISEADAQAFIDKYMDIMANGMVAYMKDFVKDMGTSFEDYLATLGMTEQEFVDSMMEEFDTAEIKKGLTESITEGANYYKLENGKIYISDSKDFEEEDGAEYQITATMLTIEEDGIKLTFNKK